MTDNFLERGGVVEDEIADVVGQVLDLQNLFQEVKSVLLRDIFGGLVLQLVVAFEKTVHSHGILVGGDFESQETGELELVDIEH